MFKGNKTLSFLWQFIKRYKISYLTTLIFVVLFDIIELIGSNMLFKKAMDGLSLNKINFIEARKIFLVFILCSSIMLASIGLRKIFSFSFQFKLKEDIRNYLFHSLLKQSNAFFSNNFVGTLNSKINDITNNIGEFLTKTIDIISNLNGFIVAIMIFAFKNYKLIPFLIFWSIVYFYLYYKISNIVKGETEVATNIESACSGKIIDCFTNIVNIKNFSREIRERYNVKKHTKTILRERKKIILTQTKLNVVNFISKTSFAIVIVLISLKMYFDKLITLGDLTFNITVSTQIFWWLRWALQLMSENIETYGKMKQAIETLVVEPTIKDKQNAKKLDIFNGKIEFKNISFKY